MDREEEEEDTHTQRERERIVRVGVSWELHTILRRTITTTTMTAFPVFSSILGLERRRQDIWRERKNHHIIPSIIRHLFNICHDCQKKNFSFSSSNSNPPIQSRPWAFSFIILLPP